MDFPFSTNVNDDSLERESAEDNDNTVLKYINQVLMEDDSEDKSYMIQESTLQAAEKSFYKILYQKYPSSPYQHLLHEDTSSSSDDSVTHCYKSVESSFTADGPLETLVNVPLENQSGWEFNGGIEEINSMLLRGDSGDLYFEGNGLTLENQSGWEFNGGIEEINSMLLSGDSGDLYFEGNRLTPDEVKETDLKKDERGLEKSSLTGRKNLHREESDLEEGRSNKYLAVYHNESILHEVFDKVLSLNDESVLNCPQQHGRCKGSIGELTYSKKGPRKREAVDMRSLLTQCMQSVGDNDHRNAAKLLKQIRLLSSPSGDGTQRLAHYFANSLEARLVGAGSPEYNAFSSRTLSDADILRAYKLYLSSVPFMENSHISVAQIIMDLTEEASSIHVIHFGIIHGLQWIPLIQRLSTRPGGPPKLRITGIDLPQSGFRPGARAKETGLRLANYCERFHVPFEYNGIEQKWETISVEDLKIEKGEILVVNCLYQLMYLLDDTVMEDSPRDAFLNLIRRINPALFIHKIANAAFNSPFFISRFREALFFYSSLFDMFEANVPRESWDRLVFEREIWGNEILNVVACEGFARVIRPETYKQWQIRTLRAGFRQLPLSQKIIKKIKAKVKSCYHKDFFVDEAGDWMLEGWKGRVIFALSCWKPT
ncbi:scarecrow-like protein 14 [Actinidia eriantha]|uniref:scarecrow-like protein 14 n=1 Tax=Actinidia eriantha TaxID=165200 RepID=UPI002588F196|nr:scarecrow-like protein 14 [Actinidia eriantha]